MLSVPHFSTNYFVAGHVRCGKMKFRKRSTEDTRTLIRLRCAARIYLQIVIVARARARTAYGRDENRDTRAPEARARVDGGTRTGGDTVRLAEGGTRPGGEGRRRYRTGREHNVSHRARSCIFYDMASNLTSRARHNSRPCSAVCVCVRVRARASSARHPSCLLLLHVLRSPPRLFLLFSSSLALWRSRDRAGRASAARTRVMRNRRTHACAHGILPRTGRYACVRAHRNH